MSTLIGRYVIVRCHDAGVHAGVLKSYSGRECIITDARRLWYWKPAKAKWLDGVALYGVHTDSKLGDTVPERLLTEDCEITVCTPEGEHSIRNHVGD